MRAAEHAPHSPFQILETRHGLAEIVERSVAVLVEHPRVNHPHGSLCLLDQNLVDEAATLLVSCDPAEQSLGEEHVICLEMGWRLAQAIYKKHFFGHSNYRDMLMISIGGHTNALDESTRLLGVEHPTTLAIRASLKLCFEEQLDWTLDDVPREHIDALDEIPRPPGHKVFWK